MEERHKGSLPPDSMEPWHAGDARDVARHLIPSLALRFISAPDGSTIVRVTVSSPPAEPESQALCATRGGRAGAEGPRAVP